MAIRLTRNQKDVLLSLKSGRYELRLEKGIVHLYDTQKHETLGSVAYSDFEILCDEGYLYYWGVEGDATIYRLPPKDLR